MVGALIGAGALKGANTVQYIIFFVSTLNSDIPKVHNRGLGCTSKNILNLIFMKNDNTR